MQLLDNSMSCDRRHLTIPAISHSPVRDSASILTVKDTATAWQVLKNSDSINLNIYNKVTPPALYIYIGILNLLVLFLQRSLKRKTRQVDSRATALDVTEANELLDNRHWSRSISRGHIIDYDDRVLQHVLPRRLRQTGTGNIFSEWTVVVTPTRGAWSFASCYSSNHTSFTVCWHLTAY
jgi:hypothetical protein